MTDLEKSHAPLSSRLNSFASLFLQVEPGEDLRSQIVTSNLMNIRWIRNHGKRSDGKKK